MLFITAPAPIVPTDMNGYKVVAVDRQVAFAGKLGQRVTDTLTVEADGMTYTVKLGHHHTLMGKIVDFKVGDHVQISGIMAGKTILAAADSVHRL